MLSENNIIIFVSGTNGSITFDLGKLHSRYEPYKVCDQLSVTYLEFYLSVRDLENLDKMKLLQNLHLNTHKSICAKRLKPFGEIGKVGKIPANKHICHARSGK